MRTSASATLTACLAKQSACGFKICRSPAHTVSPLLALLKTMLYCEYFYLPCSLQRLQMLLPPCCCLPHTKQSCPHAEACLMLQLAPGPIRFDVPESAKDRSIAGKFRSPINL